MTHIAQETCKFLAGYAAAETIAHWWMGLWGRDLLPMDLGWFTFTQPINTFAMIFWPMALIALAYFGWLRTRATTPWISHKAPAKLA